jgi:hypothetical protein
MSHHDAIVLGIIEIGLFLVLPLLIYGFGAFVFSLVYLRKIQKLNWIVSILISIIATAVYIILSVLLSSEILSQMPQTSTTRESISVAVKILPYVGALAIYIKSQYA